MSKFPQTDNKPLHSTIRHQLKVSKLHRITREDMVKLDYFRRQVFSLGEKHRQLWSKYNFFNISGYTDPKICEKYGTQAASEMCCLYEDWLGLRREMEQFLELKDLPMTYDEHVWSRPYVVSSSGTMKYDGTYVTTGFDSGPAKWCEITLDGMTSKMHSRRHLLRIEQYSIAGFATGIIGIVLSLVMFFY